MTPRIVLETSITPAEDVLIRAALCLCFPVDREVFSHTRAWHGTFPTWSVIVEHHDQVIAHVGIVERKILVGNEHIRAAGIQNVLVVPEYRKKHLFRQIMSVAIEEARRRNIDMGILFCTLNLAPIYAGLGWHLLRARSVTRIDEKGIPQPLPERPGR